MKKFAKLLLACLICFTVIAGLVLCRPENIGVAGPIEPGQKLNHSELLRQADTALYRAKDAGRNRTIA